jgi:osmotically-inducible protein OsmY
MIDGINTRNAPLLTPAMAWIPMGRSNPPMEESMNQRSLVRTLVLGAAFMTTAVVASTEPSMTITEQRLVDQRIQSEVMNVLARNTEYSGKVGVETKDQVVNLSGYLMTNGQVMRAGREAGSVMGVRYVVNEIRPRVGPITN